MSASVAEGMDHDQVEVGHRPGHQRVVVRQSRRLNELFDQGRHLAGVRAGLDNLVLQIILIEDRAGTKAPGDFDRSCPRSMKCMLRIVDGRRSVVHVHDVTSTLFDPRIACAIECRLRPPVQGHGTRRTSEKRLRIA